MKILGTESQYTDRLKQTHSAAVKTLHWRVATINKIEPDIKSRLDCRHMEARCNSQIDNANLIYALQASKQARVEQHYENNDKSCKADNKKRRH
jgi:hypothetical protein